MIQQQRPPELSPSTPPGFDPKYGDRILGWCLLASILINIGFGIWLSFADLYGTQRQAELNKQMKVAVYRPPVKQKPKPKPKPKIIPPKPKIIPQVVHIRPQPQPKPPPPRPVPKQQFITGHHVDNVHAVVTEPHPPDNTPPQQTTPVEPNNTTVEPTKPEPTQPVQPTTPVVVEKHDPVVVEKHDPVVVKHHDVDVQSREASINDSSIDTPDTSDLDPPPSSACVITCEVDENGHLSGGHVKKSSGNSQFDQRCLDAIRRGRGTPAVQDYILYRQRVEYTFSV